ncbi:MAG: hypothetical protein IPK67_18750 [Planctomycetes bacterium]|nr:hypothetical protein [Planctomycetota bacterium]
MRDRPPPLPPAPLAVRGDVARLLPNLYDALRCRTMHESREEPLQLSYAVRPDLVEQLSRALEACVRTDPALWAGFQELALSEEEARPFGLLLWPGWLQLRIRAK